MKEELKKIALIGRPNVGKSSLFNRIAKQRLAIISDLAGTTRDIKKYEVEILDKKALIIDTGGIDKKDDELFINVKRKAIQCAQKAHIILFIVDGKKIPEDEDKKLFYELQSLNKSLALVVNKIDNDKEKERLWSFNEFGIKHENLFGISVLHNRGTKKLFQWLWDLLPEVPSINIEPSFNENETKKLINSDTAKKVNNNINVAIIGRANVGKSSILNALIGEDRSVVSPVLGTTIDPVDETFEYKDKKITFIDTAGLRRRGKIEGIEKYALMRTQNMLKRSDLALVVLDASQELVDLDEKIAGLVDQYGLGTIIVLNKWDKNIETFEKFKEKIRRKFKFLFYCPIIVVSAKTHRSIDKLKDKIVEIYDNYTQRISTSNLNQIIEKAVMNHALPSPNGNYLKIYYTTQFESKPPRIALVMNKPTLLHFSYKRYLINYLRENINFEGTPIHILARKKGERLEDVKDEKKA